MPSVGLTNTHCFYNSKKIAKTIFQNHRETLYCGCRFNQNFKVDLQRCNMNKARHIPRAHNVEWEHMMPAENFGRQFRCWREKLCTHKGKSFKGRKCCQKIDKKFNEAEGELYNLWPAVGVVNQARSNFRFTPLEGSDDFYGCPIKINARLRKVEPPDRAKGIVARANLFMSLKYKIKLSPSQRKLFEIWDKKFPPSAWELEWSQRIKKIEGYPNPYIIAHLR